MRYVLDSEIVLYDPFYDASDDYIDSKYIVLGKRKYVIKLGNKSGIIQYIRVDFETKSLYNKFVNSNNRTFLEEYNSCYLKQDKYGNPIVVISEKKPNTTDAIVKLGTCGGTYKGTNSYCTGIGGVKIIKTGIAKCWKEHQLSHDYLFFMPNKSIIKVIDYSCNTPYFMLNNNGNIETFSLTESIFYDGELPTDLDILKYWN